jgi:hypothetical protein
MTIERVRQALRGISGVHVTPYGADGSVDVPLMTSVVERIARAGVHNIVSAGNTGEFYTLTPGEIRLVHETAIRAAKGRALVTAAVGRSLAEAVATGREAATMGADAVMAHQPLDLSQRRRRRPTISSPSPMACRRRSSPMCARTISAWRISCASPRIRTSPGSSSRRKT